MRKAIIVFILFLSIFNLRIASAMERLSLKEAIRIALKDNPRLKSYQWKLKGSEAELSISKARWLPTISFEESFSRTNNPTYAFMAKLNQERFTQEDFSINRINSPDGINNFQTKVELVQPVFVPKIKHSIKISKRLVASRGYDLERQQEKVVLNVIKTYLDVKKAKEFLKVAELSLKDAEEHLRVARTRYEKGVGLYSDVLRAEVAKRDAQKRITKAKNALKIAQLALGLLLGRTTPLDVQEEEIELKLEDIERLEEEALNRADIRAMKEKLQVQEIRVGLEKDTFLPEVGLRAAYQFDSHEYPLGTEGNSYTIGLFLRWNLFDPTLKPRVNRAKAELEQLREAFEGMKKEALFRVHEAYARVQELRENRLLSIASVKEAREAVRIVSSRYKNSLSPMVDLLDAQLMLDTARAKAVEAELEYQKAIADLYFQSGIIKRIIYTGGSS